MPALPRLAPPPVMRPVPASMVLPFKLSAAVSAVPAYSTQGAAVVVLPSALELTFCTLPKVTLPLLVTSVLLSKLTPPGLAPVVATFSDSGKLAACSRLVVTETDGPANDHVPEPEITAELSSIDPDCAFRASEPLAGASTLTDCTLMAGPPTVLPVKVTALAPLKS